MIKHSILGLAAIGLALSACLPQKKANSQLEYYGTDSFQGRLTFSGSIEFTVPGPIGWDDNDKPVISPSYERVRNYTHQRHLKYLISALKEHTGDDKVTNFSVAPGVPAEDTQVTNAKVVELSSQNGVKKYRLTYDYSDKVAFSKKLLEMDTVTHRPEKKEYEIHFRMPKQIASIFEIGVRDGKNLCTDPGHPSPHDYWYFWNPYRSGCPAEMMKETQVIKGIVSVEGEVSTTQTYPEYNRLVEDGVLDIVYVVGNDKDTTKADDAGRLAFYSSYNLLTKGKAVLEEDIELSSGTINILSDIPDASDLKFKVLEESDTEKTLYAFRDGKRIVVHMFFVDPKYDTLRFAGMVKDAIMSSDIFIYDGHSGLGGTLPPSKFFNKDISFPKTKYQIAFFNGCSTYAYYNKEYFDLKQGGSKNLDIVTTSVGALWSAGAESDVVFILGLTNGTKPTWQKLMDYIYEVEPDSSALTQVNGDEDNPTQAP